MEKKKRRPGDSGGDQIGVDPSKRLCPLFDSVGVAKYRVARRGEMGVRTVDDCPEEHIQ
jgi:hypothetical protein